MRNLYVLTVVAVMLLLSGCSQLGSQDAATNAGKGLAGKAVDAAGTAGQKAEEFSLARPDIVAAAIVSLIGAWLLSRLWKSAPFRYFLLAAAVAWVAYTTGQATH